MALLTGVTAGVVVLTVVVCICLIVIFALVVIVTDLRRRLASAVAVNSNQPIVSNEHTYSPLQVSLRESFVVYQLISFVSSSQCNNTFTYKIQFIICRAFSVAGSIT